MIYQAFGKNFSTQKDMFKYIQVNKKDIISLKKAVVKNSDGINYSLVTKSEAVKSLIPDQEIKAGSKVYPVINSSYYMDSHDDVHVDGIWNKSVTDQQGKIYFVADHKLEVDKVISRPNEVKMILMPVNWNDMGQAYKGTTEALIFEATLSERSMKAAVDALREKDPVEYSIRMIYVDLNVAINDKSTQYRNEYMEWEKHIDKIANKERAEQRGFFFPIYEAKIFKEGSMVLAGSHDATTTLYSLDDIKRPPEGTSDKKSWPSQDTVQRIIENSFKTLKIN